MKQFVLRLTSTIGVCIIVCVIGCLPLLIIKSDAGQLRYFMIGMWVAISFHIVRFMNWLFKDKEDNR